MVGATSCRQNRPKYNLNKKTTSNKGSFLRVSHFFGFLNKFMQPYGKDTKKINDFSFFL